MGNHYRRIDDFGEPIPLDKKQTIQLLQVQLTEINLCDDCRKIGSETLLSQIVQMVNSASRSRAPIQNWPTE
jgi:Cu2+-exporting ATPase